MLVDIKPRPNSQMNVILNAIAELNGNSTSHVRLAKGVYETGSFSFDHAVGIHWDDHNDNYPDLTLRKDTPVVAFGGNPGPYVGGESMSTGGGKEGEYFGCYGVCDTWTQVIELCAELQDSCPIAFCMSVTPVRKANQPSKGGWRWHKWGEYIGSQNPQYEYLYDEPNIEMVYCYHVYKVPPHLIDNSGQFDQKALP